MEYRQLFLLAIVSVISVAGWDNVMEDRFAMLFYNLNHNGDDIVSLDDLDTCKDKQTEQEQNVRVKVKCEEFLPRWFIHCIMGGYDGLSEREFIERFQRMDTEKGTAEFTQMFFKCAQVGYRIVDLNGDGFVTNDEDRCMSKPTRPQDAARDMTAYLMNDAAESFVERDVPCPWVGAAKPAVK